MVLSVAAYQSSDTPPARQIAATRASYTSGPAASDVTIIPDSRVLRSPSASPWLAPDALSTCGSGGALV